MRLVQTAAWRSRNIAWRATRARHIRLEHRMSVEQVLEEWQSAGFELVELYEGLPTQHLFVFTVSEEVRTAEKE